MPFQDIDSTSLPSAQNSASLTLSEWISSVQSIFETDILSQDANASRLSAENATSPTLSALLACRGCQNHDVPSQVTGATDFPSGEGWAGRRSQMKYERKMLVLVYTVRGDSKSRLVRKNGHISRGSMQAPSMRSYAIILEIVRLL